MSTGQPAGRCGSEPRTSWIPVSQRARSCSPGPNDVVTGTDGDQVGELLAQEGPVAAAVVLVGVEAAVPLAGITTASPRGGT